MFTSSILGRTGLKGSGKVLIQKGRRKKLPETICICIALIMAAVGVWQAVEKGRIDARERQITQGITK